MRWVYDHAADYGGDNTRIFMGGDSGGAYHSALYAGIFNKPEVLRELGIERSIPPQCLKGLVLFYGVAGFDSAKHTLFPMRDLIGYGFICFPFSYMKRDAISESMEFLDGLA